MDVSRQAFQTLTYHRHLCWFVHKYSMLAGSPDKHWQSLQLHQIESTPWFFQRSCCLVQASPTEESQPQICRPSEWSMASSDAFQTTSHYFSRWCFMGTPRAGKWIEGPLQHLYGHLEPWEEIVDVKSFPLYKEWAVDAFSLIYKWCNFEIPGSPNPWNSCLEDPHVVGKSRIQVLGRIDDHLAESPKFFSQRMRSNWWNCAYSTLQIHIKSFCLQPFAPTDNPSRPCFLRRAYPLTGSCVSWAPKKMHAVNERKGIY